VSPVINISAAGSTPPAPVGDEFWSSVRLLAPLTEDPPLDYHGESPNHILTPFDSGSPDTSAIFEAGVAPFSEPGSYLLDDSDEGRIELADHPDWTFSGDFTLDIHYYFATAPGSGDGAGILSQWGADGQRGWALYRAAGDQKLYWQFTSTGSGNGLFWGTAGAWTPSSSTWGHLRVCREGNEWYVFDDGVEIIQQTSSSAIFNSNNPLRIGDLVNWSPSGRIGRNLYGVRITDGVARSNANFDPPSSPYPMFGD
jgi:hypothetical protein